jgi:phosphoglucomutase
MARRGQAPDELYEALAQRLGRPHYARKDLPVTPEAKARLSELTLEAVGKEVAGEPILQVLNRAPGNGEPLGGLKVVTENA